MRDGITTDYADGYREGWRAAQEQIAAELREDARNIVDHMRAERIRRLEPPPPMREPDGLAGRGA